MCQVQLTVPVGLHHQRNICCKSDIKILQLKSLLVTTICVSISMTSELMNLGVLNLLVVCTVYGLECCITVPPYISWYDTRHCEAGHICHVGMCANNIED